MSSKNFMKQIADIISKEYDTKPDENELLVIIRESLQIIKRVSPTKYQELMKESEVPSWEKTSFAYLVKEYIFVLYRLAESKITDADSCSEFIRGN
jgi:hypothetical protein